jgi:hypothetical protein
MPQTVLSNYTMNITRMVLCIDMAGLREIMKLTQSIFDGELLAETVIDTQLKASVFAQLYQSCKLLGDFARKYSNPIAQMYDSVVTSLDSCARNDEQLANVFKNSSTNSFVQKQTDIIRDFEYSHPYSEHKHV